MITILLNLLTQLKVYHWQTNKHFEHNALNTTYVTLDGLIDSFIEVFMGKNGIIKNKDGFTIKLLNYVSSEETIKFINNYILLISTTIKLDERTDSELIGLRDDILVELYKLKYLLSMN